MTSAPKDIKAKIKEHRLVVTWTDDHVASFDFKYLRCHCGCAGCVDERSGVRTLDTDSIPEDIGIKDMALAGNYAIQIIWSDGHDTGIYSWDYLQKICPCERCGGPKSFERRPSPTGGRKSEG